MSESWGAKLWQYRKSLKMSRKAFSEKLQISEQTLRSYETEARKPGYEIYNKINLFMDNNVKPTNQTKGEEEMVDVKYIIDLQKDKIQYQQQEIERLANIVEKTKSTKSKPAFHFKTKCEYDPETKTFGNNIVTGDTSMTGYTEEELSKLTSEEWSLMYHHDSLEILLASIPDDIPDYTHNMWKHILWKAKDGSYRMYNIESYHDKTEGVVRAYYYWVNGDIEGRS